MSKPTIHRPPGRGQQPGFVTWYRHYRTGKIMRAEDYGYKAWPFGRR